MTSLWTEWKESRVRWDGRRYVAKNLHCSLEDSACFSMTRTQWKLPALAIMTIPVCPSNKLLPALIIVCIIILISHQFDRITALFWPERSPVSFGSFKTINIAVKLKHSLAAYFYSRYIGIGMMMRGSIPKVEWVFMDKTLLAYRDKTSDMQMPFSLFSKKHITKCLATLGKYQKVVKVWTW